MCPFEHIQEKDGGKALLSSLPKDQDIYRVSTIAVSRCNVMYHDLVLNLGRIGCSIGWLGSTTWFVHLVRESLVHHGGD